MDQENTISSHGESSDPSGGERENHNAQPKNKKRKTTTSRVKKGKGSKRSEVWKHFTKLVIDGVDYGKCNHCPDKKYKADKTTNGTSGMLKHMRNCPNHPSRLENQTNVFVKEEKDGSGSVQFLRFDSERIRKALVKMIIVDELSFSFVEKEGFKGFMEVVCPNFKIPSRTTVSRDVSELFVEEKSKLKALIKNGKQRVSLTTDTWTSIQRVNYMVVTAHFIDESWKLQKRIITFKPIYSHKGDDIGREIIDCLHDWDIDHLMSITADNASSNDTALVFLKKKIPTKMIANGEYIQMRCAAHILNLIVKEGLKRYSKPLEHVRGAVKYIRQSTSRCDIFKSCVDQLKLKSKAMLHLDCPTRWNSTYDMLEIAEKLQGAFDLYERKDRNYIHDLGDDIPTCVNWGCIEKLTRFLRIFKTKTEKLSGTSYVVANSFFNEVIDLDEQLNKLANDSDMEYKVMSMEMRKKFDKYWNDIKKLNMLMYFAAVLDPRMKLSIIKFGFKRIFDMKSYETLEGESQEKLVERVESSKQRDVEFHVGLVERAMKLLYEEYRLMYGVGSSKENYKSQENVVNLVDEENEFVEAFLKDGDNSNVESGTELDIYKGEPRVPMVKGFDILSWWKDNSPRFPVLSKMAKDILAIPVTSVASESAFSTGGRVLDAFRSSLSPSKVEALICTQDWMRISRNVTDMDEDLDDIDMENVKASDQGTMKD